MSRHPYVTRLALLACMGLSGLLLPALAWSQGCTGCTVTYTGNDTVLTFNGSGTFTPPADISSVNALVVAGGGGGGGLGAGNTPGGGGGGAGGYQ